MPAPDLFRGFYDSSGILVGAQVAGCLVLPFSLASGIIMQDSSGVYWILTVGTDGRLSTNSVTF